MTKHIPFRIGDKVVSSTKSGEVGVISATNSFGEVLVQWPNGRQFWTKTRHLLRATK